MLVSLAIVAASNDVTVAAPWIDLLPYIDAQHDAVKGEWKMAPYGLALAKPENAAVLQLPYESPEEYDFLIEFSVLGSGNDVTQCVYAGGRSFMWRMGRSPAPRYCFERLDGKDAGQNCETASQRSQGLDAGKRHTSMIEVRQDSLRVLVDGEEYLKWSGDFRRLGTKDEFVLRDVHRLGIGSWRRAVVFHRVEVREIRGAGKLTQTGPATKLQVTVKPMELTNSIGMKLTPIPAGEFLMGEEEQRIAAMRERNRTNMEKAVQEAQTKGDDQKREDACVS